MMPLAYCEIADVEAIVSVHGITALMDDDASYALGVQETTFAQQAIERAAVLELNYHLGQRYKLSELEGNTWCKWVNAVFAAEAMAVRRLQESPKALKTQAELLRAQLRLIRRGYAAIPAQAESFDFMPATTTFEIERIRSVSPVRVNVQESTREAPEPEIRRLPARLRSYVDGW